VNEEPGSIRTRGITDPAWNRLKHTDFAAIDSVGSEVRVSQVLIDETSGSDYSSVHYVRTPAGGGSEGGMHSHEFEQIFYILSGQLHVEYSDGRCIELARGDLVVIPPGVQHRNFNAAGTECLHLSFNTPRPLTVS
jgi:quercetin dioxygenase-like cupin family protein